MKHTAQNNAPYNNTRAKFAWDITNAAGLRALGVDAIQQPVLQALCSNPAYIPLAKAV
jgi:hypothetical protein